MCLPVVSACLFLENVFATTLSVVKFVQQLSPCLSGSKLLSVLCCSKIQVCVCVFLSPGQAGSLAYENAELIHKSYAIIAQ